MTNISRRGDRLTDPSANNGEWEERRSDEVRADTEGLALRSSLLELVVVENEGILLYGSMFVTCFRFIEVVDTCGSESDEHNKRSMV